MTTIQDIIDEDKRLYEEIKEALDKHYKRSLWGFYILAGFAGVAFVGIIIFYFITRGG